jgi:hypothetical protein
MPKSVAVEMVERASVILVILGDATGKKQSAIGEKHGRKD